MKNSAKPILEVKNLVKKFGDFTAVDGISFEIKEGEILGFLGPNGAGKSTTINCILGVVEKDGGEIKIFDKNLSSANRTQIMADVNYCSAEYTLPWNLKIEECLLVYAKLYGVKDVKKRIEEVLDLLELGDLRKKFIRDLSFGQRTRANLCKALLNRPRLLLLDEPMASMDPDVVDRGIKLIKKIQKDDGISILYTSHNMWEIEQVAGNVVFVNHGKVMAQGSPLDLTRQELELEAKEPNLREVFIQLSRKSVSGEENEG
ncbi:MAG: ABC transporter ATP-binding protein [Candidatus Curtissbacteria bacterium]|nr:ABC transporter ATP-binding protein [Candidatus Curtissbacteria bacterium]